MKKAIHLLLFLLVFVLFNAADCNVSEDEETCYLSEETKKYILFGENAHWVYQSNINTRDSISVSSLNHYVYEQTNVGPFEEYEIVMHSSLEGEKKYLLRCHDLNAVGCEGVDVYSTYTIDELLFFCCCKTGTTRKNLNYTSELDSMNIHENTFYKVKVFESDSIKPGSMKKLYYAIDVGLVQYENYKNETWKIISYSIKN